MSDLRQQLHRLIIENRQENGSITIDDQSAMANEILQLIADRLKLLQEQILKEAIVPAEIPHHNPVITGVNETVKNCNAIISKAIKETK